MERRTFIVATAGGAIAVSLAAEAQQGAKFTSIGFLQSARNENAVAFIQALRDAGYLDGRNAVVETRIYGGMPERLPHLAEELVALRSATSSWPRLRIRFALPRERPARFPSSA